MPKLVYLKVRDKQKIEEVELGYLYYGTRRWPHILMSLALAPFPNLTFLSTPSLCVWRNLFQVPTKAIKALSSLLMYSIPVSKYANSYLLTLQFFYIILSLFLNLFCRVGKLRMDCRTRVVPQLSCIFKKLWIWTFLTYPQSHLADIPPDCPNNCGFGLSSPTLKRN